MSQYIRIETTNICNLRCTFCPQSNNNKSNRGVMSYPLFAKIISEISAFRENQEAPAYLHISGEPLLNQHLTKMVGMASQAGLKPFLTTNATLLTETISYELVHNGLHTIEFSFEGIDKSIYESLRVNAKFEPTLKNIETFLRINREAGSPVETVLVILDVPSICSDQIQAYAATMQSKFNRVQVAGYFDWLGSVKQSHFARSSYKVCPAPDVDLNVLWDGRVIPCCMDVEGEMTIGDFNTMNYLEILASPERKLLKKRLMNKDLHGLPCARCIVPWGAPIVRNQVD